MDALARRYLDKLLASGEKALAGRRVRKAMFTKAMLAEYRMFRSLEAKESFETTMRAARASGAIELIWDDKAEEGFIKRINLVSARQLAGFLGEAPMEEQLAHAKALFSPLCIRFPVFEEIIQRWTQLRNVRGLGTRSAQDWLDAVRVIDFARETARPDAIAVPIREASARLFKDSKRIEKLAGIVDVLLSGSVDGEIRQPAEVWKELGLFREEHPVRLAGNVIVERDRVTTYLDTPYSGLPAATVRRLVSTPRLVMTIENQTTFHSEARRRCDEDVLLIFTAGMPTPAWRNMYVRLLTSLPIDVPVYHWGDVDEGGFRIAAILAQDARSVGHILQPWSMHPSNVPVQLRRSAKESTLTRMKYFANLAGWSQLGDAVSAAKFTAEQEGLRIESLR